MPKTTPSVDRSALLSALRSDAAAEWVDYDRYVDDHVRRTSQTLRGIDLASTLLTLAVGWIALLFFAALCEHWLAARGFSAGIRYGVFLVGIGLTVRMIISRMWPLLTRRINPLFAADAIERSAPSLKNSLVNLLLLRDEKEALPAAVAQTLEQQAAEGLVRTPEEGVVDRTGVVRLAGGLVAIVVVVAFYALLSPKDPFTTARRVLAPWAKIAPPSRVRIVDVAPGDATVVQGEGVEFSATVKGLDREETAFLVLRSAEGPQSEVRAPLAPGESDRYAVSTSSPAVGALSHDVFYHIEAGDARSVKHRLLVKASPTLAIKQVDYDYPDYTGYLNRTEDRQGDLRAIEGTRVTIVAESNGPMKTAHIDFEGDGTNDLAMQIAGRTAQATFTLALRDDGTTPKQTRYVLRLQTPEERSNLYPASYRIDVYPDYRPEVEIAKPTDPVREVRLDETIVVTGEARDPDFGLARVAFLGVTERGTTIEERLLSEPMKAPFSFQYRFTPTDHGLRVGDIVDYAIQASDVRQPSPNVARSRQRRFIIAPAGDQPNQNQRVAQADPDSGEATQDQRNSQASPEVEPQGNQPGDTQKEPGQAGGVNNESSSSDDSSEAGQGAQQGEGQSQQESDSAEGETNQGRASSSQIETSDAENQENAQGNGGGESRESGESRQEQGDGMGSGGSDSSSNNRGGVGQQNVSEQGDSSKENSRPSPVSPDGADDGAAFERILEHMNNDRSEGESGPPQERSGDEPQGNTLPELAEQTTPGSEPSSSKGENRPKNPDDANPNANPRETEKESSQSPKESGSANGEQANPRGEAGSGDEATPQGAPATDQLRRPTEKSQSDSGQSNQPDSPEPPSPGESGHESDSESEQGGDRSGGGREGVGQQALRQGTGSQGQNQASDQGAGSASDPGSGETDQQEGADTPSDQPTGVPGTESGPGSTKRSGQGEQSAGDSSGSESLDANPADGERGEPTDAANEASESNPQERSPQARNQPSSKGETPGGAQGDAGVSPSRSDNQRMQSVPPNRQGGEEGGDDPNLDYARKKTDLVLDQLSDQLKKKDVDRALLDKLGWSEQELKQFVERWRRRQTEAHQDDQASQELDDALRSLGLRSGPTSGRLERRTDDLRVEAGRKDSVPQQYRSHLRNYLRALSQDQNE